MEKIIECVPNFSEGRDPEKIAAIADAIKSVSGTLFLHQTSDRDHNRTVMTFAGPPEAVIESAFRAVKKAGELIDLGDHQGVHPRIGAADVVPLVPLKNITIEKCVQFAKQLGQRLGEELNLPIYLYEKAAQTPERQNLANIRKTEFRKAPDFGPSQPGKAGATVVGVRDILVAFNINLKSTDLTLAKKIAHKIRERNGGLKAVKALGFELKERKLVQVSMNLIDYKTTGPGEVFDFIQKAAASENTEIFESELIGMIPEDALFPDFATDLKLTNFSNDQILSLSRLQNQKTDV